MCPPYDGEGDLGKAIHLDCSCRLRLKVDHAFGFIWSAITTTTLLPVRWFRDAKVRNGPRFPSDFSTGFGTGKTL
jgi:hypothetical protein